MTISKIAEKCNTSFGFGQEILIGIGSYCSEVCSSPAHNGGSKRQSRLNVKVMLTVFFDCKIKQSIIFIILMFWDCVKVRMKRSELWHSGEWVKHDNAPAHSALTRKWWQSFVNPCTHLIWPLSIFYFPRLSPSSKDEYLTQPRG